MDQIICPACALTQFLPARGKCRRCGELFFTLIEVSLAGGTSRGDSIRLGAAIRKIRRLQRRNQACVSAAARVDRAHLSRVESGASSPRLHTLARILRALGADAIILRVQEPRPCSRHSARLDPGKPRV